jgi:hydrogenase maturation protein HypF
LGDRIRIKVTGIVQGVGFRPFIYNLAQSLNLKGFVLNSSEGVTIEVEGKGIDDFLEKLKNSPPPLSRIESISTESLTPLGYENFEIKESLAEKDKFALVSADIAVCNDCLSELLDPENRRFQYPFINCTNCGPRYSIVLDIPYDRPKTTMSKFKMCPQCQSEYEDPSNRRFHAQPNACPVCGPSLTFRRTGDSRLKTEDNPMERTIQALREGEIVAIKGLGGFHLACDATNDAAVSKLRERKRKSNKPFAVMAPDLESIKMLCRVSKEEEELLRGSIKPIVLLSKLPHNPLSEAVAPNNNYFGVMLPYTPMHYLLFYQLTKSEIQVPNFLALVMTSGNLSEEPIVIDSDESLEVLKEIADSFLLHDRDIYMRVDDPVTRVFEGKEMLIRRSRGYVPKVIDLNHELVDALGCGAELKNTFTLTKAQYAIVSQHIGDLENYEALEFFQETLRNLKKTFRVEPKVLAYDLHPDYLSTKFALEQKGVELVGVQHHYAHIVSCMAENGLEGKVIGVAFDGLGYGADGNIWGGEFLVADRREFSRRAHFRYLPMPGGDKAPKEPYRMALSYLFDTFGEGMLAKHPDFFKRFPERNIALITKMIKNKIHSPITSSCGRLFDAVSSIIGVRDYITFEGEAAVELEMMAEEGCQDSYSFEIRDKGVYLIEPSSVIVQVVEDLYNNVSRARISAKFHNTVARIILDVCERIRKDEGLPRVALSGGVFQNLFLLRKSLMLLEKQGFEAYIHRIVPPNDGGISLGQVVVASNLIN